MITSSQREFLSAPIALWMAAADTRNVADIIRCIGTIVEDEKTLQCFFSEKFSGRFRQCILSNSRVSLFATNVQSFASYQYKGRTEQIRIATRQEVEYQKTYLTSMAELTIPYGLDASKVFGLYYYQPSYSMKITVEHIFEQTPRQNTGGELRQ